MNCLRVLRLSTLVLACLSLSGAIAQGADGLPIKAVIDAQQAGENLLKPDAWFRYEAGFQREGSVWVCDNGTDLKAQRGAGQGVELNQTKPEPMVASAWSKAENVSGSADNNYSLYLDLVYADGTTLWGQAAPFSTGTHDWQRRQVIILPEKPVKRLSCYTLFRSHSGKAWFRDVERDDPDARGRRHVRRRAHRAARRERRGLSGPRRGRRFGVCWDRPGSLGLEAGVHEKRARRRTFFDVTLADTTARSGRDAVLRDPDRTGRAPLVSRSPADKVGRAVARIRERHELSRRGQWAAVALSAGGRRRRDECRRAGDRHGPAGLLPARLQRRHGRVVPGLRPGPDPRKADGAGAVLLLCVWARWASGAMARYYELFPKRSAAARPSKGFGCRLPRSARSKAGRILGSSSKRETTKPDGTTSTDHHVPLHRADDLVDGDAQGHAAHVGRRGGRSHGWPTRATRGPRLSSRAAITTRPASFPPGCLTRPGATARSGA